MSAAHRASEGFRMHWFWRATIALLGAAVVTWFLENWGNPAMTTIYKLVGGPARPSQFIHWQIRASEVIIFLPIPIVALVLYGLLTRYLGTQRPDGETRCRKCGYILRGISEPRCPECGERI